MHKYNIKSTQKPLSECLGEPDRFKKFSAKTGDLLLDFFTDRNGSTVVDRITDQPALENETETVPRDYGLDAILGYIRSR